MTLVMRILFGALLAFEFLNWIGVIAVRPEFTWMGLMITGGLVWAAVELVNRWMRTSFRESLPWFAFAVAFLPVLYDAVGDMAHFYGQFSWYDQYGHAQGAGASALFVFIVFWVLTKVGRVSWGLRLRSLLAFTTAVTVGVFYELEEYGEDLLACYHRDLIPTFLERVISCGYRFGDALDTGNDLFMNVVGGTVVLLIIWLVYYLKKERAR